MHVTIAGNQQRQASYAETKYGSSKRSEEKTIVPRHEFNNETSLLLPPNEYSA
jgi:hypothetical protein